MNRIFRASPPLRVPDGSLVAPFLNCRDSTSGLPFDLLEGFSLAAGTIEPNAQSKIHVMPFVTQVTLVRRGVLTVRMANDGAPPYALALDPDEAIVTEPGAFLQLANAANEPCEVLYVVSPAYVFESTGGRVIYDDSVVLDETWAQLEAAGWRASSPWPTQKQRQAAVSRIAAAARRPL